MDRNFAEQLLAATTVPALTSLLTQIQKSGPKLRWIPVGNKDNGMAFAKGGFAQGRKVVSIPMILPGAFAAAARRSLVSDQDRQDRHVAMADARSYAD